MKCKTRLVNAESISARITGNKPVFRYSQLSVCLAVALYGSVAQAGHYFDPAFLSDTQSVVADLSKFESTDTILPGTYRVDVYLNGVLINTRDVVFEMSRHAGAHADVITPCFSAQEIKDFNVNPAAVPALLEIAPEACASLQSLISDAQSTLDLEKLRLDLSVPQAMLTSKARGLVPVEEWDDGVGAFLLNYNFTGAHTRTSNSAANDTYFMNLNSGLNVGAWRLRNDSTLNKGQGYYSDAGVSWKTLSSYAQRALPGLKSSIVVGQTSTSNPIFNSFSFEGMRLASDDNMLADSEKGFAPVVRGIANSNAEVTIRQNGNVIYQTYVASGPFVINDLYPSSSNGDLQVSVTEADGRINQYSVPFSSLPILQREGRFKYDLVAGTLRATDYQDNPHILQGTLAWGLPGGLTLYGGVQNANKYQAYSLGAGQNLGSWGAFSFDATAADSTLADKSHHSGYSLRMLYAKTMDGPGTRFTLAGYQYSTRGFYNFSDTASKIMERKPSVTVVDGEIEQEAQFYDYYNLHYSKRSSVQLNISQPLGSFGSVYASGHRQTFWNTSEATDLWQAGYYTSHKGVSYTLSYNYNNNAWADKADQMFSFSASLPLGDGAWTGKRAQSSNMYARYGQSLNNKGHAQYNAGVSGNALDNRNLSYSVQQSYGDRDYVANSNVSANYRGASGNANAGYSYSNDNSNRRLNYGFSGGLVAHEHGITFSQPLGDTNILVQAPGAKNVTLMSGAGIKTDSRGYAVVPSASTYRENRVAMDVTSMANNIELDNPVAFVVPTQGALVRSTFDVRVGVRALMSLTHKGQPIPFGARVNQAQNPSDSIVGNYGQVFLSGLPLKGQLNVWWQDGPEGQCTVDYQLDEGSELKDISKLAAECV